MIRLNHIGIAVNDLTKLKKLLAVMGISSAHSEEVAEQQVNTHFFPVDGSQSNLELLEPLSKDSTIAKFIEKRGPGIHHLSFEVARGELEPLSKRIREAGYRLIYDTPKSGAHSMRVNFIHPSDAGGVLIEIMEPEK